MKHESFTAAPSLTILTEAGLRAFDRYHRDNAARTITLPTSEYVVMSDDWTPPEGGSGAAQYAGCA